MFFATKEQCLYRGSQTRRQLSAMPPEKITLVSCRPVLKVEGKKCNFAISEVCHQMVRFLHYSHPLKEHRVSKRFDTLGLYEVRATEALENLLNKRSFS